MTTLAFLEKQLQVNQANYLRESNRGATEEILHNIECKIRHYESAIASFKKAMNSVELPRTGIGDLSDGYHTFNELYYQRLILFASLVKVHKDKAWKSHRHEDGELCFGGGWFIVGIDTPEGSYTYHYEDKDFDLFECEELPVGKPWDGHTAADVTRLLSLFNTNEEIVRCKNCRHWQKGVDGTVTWCPLLMDKATNGDDYCSFRDWRDSK